MGSFKIISVKVSSEAKKRDIYNRKEGRMSWSKEMRIKKLRNGWLVKYDDWWIIEKGYPVWRRNWKGDEIEYEQAFVYNSEDKKIEAWNEMQEFLKEKVGYLT